MKLPRTCLLAAWAGCLLATPAWALWLGMPLDCTYGQTCFIQNYVDEDATASATDYRCGTLTYDGHKGTDFRLTDFAAMQRGVHVLAVADGTVLRLRNDAPDTGLDAGREAIGNRECGNGLVIAHAGGLQTQYCHMRQGSIRVQAGQQVKAGEPIGEVGYSGMTQFPHLHLQVTKDGAIVDPFNAATPMAQAQCAASHASLWGSTALPYIGTAVLGAGFSNSIPTRDSNQHPLQPMQTIPATAPMLALWVEVMGVKAGDHIVMRITGPDNATVAEANQPVDKNKASFFQYIGKRYHQPLAAGTYKATIAVERNGTRVDHTHYQLSTTVQ